MKWKVAFSILALSLATQASADEHRGGDAALGALSGAVVLGPIGAVAGAVVGYTAGPSIAHAWGFRRGSTAHQHARPVKAGRASVGITCAGHAVGRNRAGNIAAAPDGRRTRSGGRPPPVQTLE